MIDIYNSIIRINDSNLYISRIGDYFGIIDNNFNIIIEHIYDSIVIENNYLIIKKDGKIGINTLDLKYDIELNYDYINFKVNYHNQFMSKSRHIPNVILVRKRENEKLIFYGVWKDGVNIISCLYNNISFNDKTKLFTCNNYIKGKSQYCDIYDEQGILLIDNVIPTSYMNNKYQLITKQYNTYALLNLEFHKVIELNYSKILFTSYDNIFICCDNNNMNLIEIINNPDDKLVILKTVPYIEFQEVLVNYKKDKYIFIKDSNNIYKTYYRDSLNLVNDKSYVKIKLIYDDIFIVVDTNGETYIIKANGEVLFTANQIIKSLIDYNVPDTDYDYQDFFEVIKDVYYTYLRK